MSKIRMGASPFTRGDAPKSKQVRYQANSFATNPTMSWATL